MADFIRRIDSNSRCRGTNRVDLWSDGDQQEFVFYVEIDEPSSEVRILATFFGGADHRRQIWIAFGTDGVDQPRG